YAGEDGVMVHIPVLMADAFGISSSEARRLLKQGGVKLDGETLAADALDIPPRDLDGRVLQAGKRRFRGLRGGASAKRPRGVMLPGPSGQAQCLAHARRAASPVAKAQRSLKTEQRALRGPEACGLFEPDPLGPSACRGD